MSTWGLFVSLPERVSSIARFFHYTNRVSYSCKRVEVAKFAALQENEHTTLHLVATPGHVWDDAFVESIHMQENEDIVANAKSLFVIHRV